LIKAIISINIPGNKKMANLLFLILAIILLLVAVFSLVSYIRDRKKQQFTFKKRR